MHDAVDHVGPAPPNVVPLTNRVRTRRTVSWPVSPSSASRPVIMPIARTAGTVKPIVESADPRQILIDRYSRFDSAAEKALRPSGVRTRTAISTPPSVSGRPKSSMP